MEIPIEIIISIVFFKENGVIPIEIRNTFHNILVKVMYNTN